MLLTYHSDDIHVKALSSDSPLKPSGAIVRDSLMTVICMCVCVSTAEFQKAADMSTGTDTERSMWDHPTRPACSLGVT